ncbi:hypothetical protein [Leifsonia sp. AG29]|uniref:hypothetical protein n=1 Tax=Leifsonia sp. AG29 TaxID=2598860 RepID=UPI00131DD84D|nr:hypothetical protein [Leifsonia sp. AG29]
MTHPDEQTLARPLQRVAATDEREALGRARLELGFNVAALALIAFLFALQLLNLRYMPFIGLTLGAWALVIGTLAVALVLRFRLPDLLPTWLFAGALGVWALAVVLDVAGTRSADVWTPLTAAAAVGPALLLCAPVRPPRDIVAAAAVLGAVLAVVFGIRAIPAPQMLGPSFAIIAIAVAPPLIGVQIVRSLRTLVQLELDLVQVQSTVSAPGYAAGMMASEELARLDLAAERLLDGVATGRTPLPLDQATADAAAAIATELRLHLIQGRTETWLYHAVTESAVLGPSVTLSDPEGLAAGLDRDQRDGLLTAVWLLISDPVRSGTGQARSLMLDIERREGGPTALTPSSSTMAIVITTTGVPRNGVDPAAWQAIRKVGRYAESYSGSTLRIEVTTVSDTSVEPT